MNNIPIVIVAYDRFLSLNRLLRSVSNASFIESQYPKLVISIDGPGNKDVLKVANEFDWPGEKEVIVHSNNLGLKNHILWCGDLSSDYDGIVLLEDDLFVSPFFYKYALQVVNFYEDSLEKNKIAVYSLYSFELNELANLPFESLITESDVYFYQNCPSWGQVWTKRQWYLFNSWYKKNKRLDKEKSNLPKKIINWPNSSWKKFFIKYMIDHDLYAVIPKVSFTTNFGDPGINHKSTLKHQVPLCIEEREMKFINLSNSSTMYDIYFEPNLTKLLKNINGISTDIILCDLYGIRELNLSDKQYVLTSRPVKKFIKSFGLSLKPPILNVLFEIKGEKIFLTEKSNVKNDLDRISFINYYAGYITLKDKFNIFVQCIINFFEMSFLKK